MAIVKDPETKFTEVSRPASALEARENQMIDLSVDLVEPKLREGTASSRGITHYLKLGSTRERLEDISSERGEVNISSLYSDYVIQTDPDSKIREALVKTGGHCPCQIPHDDGSSFCMCQDFRDKLLDPTFYGSCICGLYTKVKR